MTACAQCLRRGLLLRALAAWIDRTVDRGASQRARDLLALDDARLAAAVGFGERQRAEVCGDRAVGELRAELETRDCWTVCPHRAEWPVQLELLGAAAPRALFGRGARAHLEALAPDADPAATLVGARRAGPYGLEVASTLGAELAAAGLTVISGMAFGIDTAAHEGALRAGGRTVALLGTGAERPYPRSRARLYRELSESALVLSELPPGAPTFRWMFPARNRIMAALAGITVVVEAAERSGSLITAEMAADCGRLVGAVPGPVTSWRSAGANMLLADGAAVIRDARDVLDHLLGPGGAPRVRRGRPLGAGELAVLDAIEAGAGTTDEVAAATGEAPASAAAAVSRLELDGYLELDFGGRCRRTTLTAPERDRSGR